ncbi:PR domain zinc finger protein 5-like isoform X4 [Danaus plexippus]|uniref:PR domain zinc finger protein 5-like isoform X4 n=1 Tax=Danaus plexippus TaxID=13037 RepID=UPI002AAF2585|nr:PR domain zinc finger protein 5-like isoform X4 [Danaus plexippus]
MEFDEIVVKDTPGLCRCCLSEGCYKDLSTEYPWMDDTEIYADMLLECFDVSISQHIEGPNGPNRLICEVCITRLRDACNFKKQVLDSEKKFIDMVGRGAFKTKVLLYPEQMKSESQEVAADEAEIEYLDEDVDYDDIPLNELATPSVSEDITVATLPVAKRGRPKKTMKNEKKKIDVKLKTKSKDCKQKISGLTRRQRQNLQILFNNTSIVPFECREGFSCVYCDLKLEYNDLKKHTKSHETSAIIEFLDGFNRNSLKVDISVTNCEVCDLCFDSFKQLIKHLVSVHRYSSSRMKCIQMYRIIDLKCFECDIDLINVYEFVRHVDRLHSYTVLNIDDEYDTVKVNKKFSFQCPECLKTLTSKLGFRMHLKKCGIDRKTESSKFRGTKTFRVRQNVACILKMSSALPFKFFKNTFRCFYCSKDCSDFDVLREHTLKYHGQFDQECAAMKKIKGKDLIVKIEITNLTCKICYEQFMGLIDLIDHIVTKHGANYDSSVECVQIFKISKDNIPCPICPDSYFGYFKKLLEHMNEHHSNNNIVCVYCGVTFRGHSNYRAHISRYHRRKACTCPECKKDFWNLEKLARHKANVHGTKNFKCVQCNEKFITQHLMRRHLVSAHGSGHKCSHCGKLFTLNSHMRNHVRRSHLKEKNVECPVCKDRFFDIALLKVHMVKHVGARNYHCDICGKKFLWKKNLRGHLASHERN